MSSYHEIQTVDRGARILDQSLRKLELSGPSVIIENDTAAIYAKVLLSIISY